MLVHDIRKNETSVIDFRETAPSAIQEEMMQKNLDAYVRQFSHSFWSLPREQNTVGFFLCVN